jgi:hypothetical protein
MIAAFGLTCITPSILYAFALLLAGWLIYAFSDRVKFKIAPLSSN